MGAGSLFFSQPLTKQEYSAGNARAALEDVAEPNSPPA